MSDAKDDVPKGERLGRGVFTRGHVKGKIRKHVFLEKQGVRSISVNRLILPPKEMAKVECHLSRLRGKELLGWAVLSVDDARQEGRKVGTDPLPENPAHANIWLPEKCANDKHLQRYHADQLARSSKWEERKKDTR